MSAVRRGSGSVAGILRIAFGVVAVLPAALAVAHLVGSLIFSGGKVSDSMDTKWGVIHPYPLFVVPTALLVALGIASIVLAIAVAWTARAADEGRVQRLIGPVMASAVSAFGLALVAPDGGVRMGDTFIGDQWIGSVLSVVALAVLLLGILAARARDASRSGEGVG